MITKFEAIGIASCIIIMVFALFLLRLDSTAQTLTSINSATQQAAVVVSPDAEDKATARVEAVSAALEGSDGQSQLVIDDISFGNGEAAKVGDTVLVHYVGRLSNGQEFDNSYKRGEPIRFTLGAGDVIAGWEQGILGMKKGGERILVIPSAFGYGDKNVGPIPAGSTLIFAVELVDIL